MNEIKIKAFYHLSNTEKEIIKNHYFQEMEYNEKISDMIEKLKELDKKKSVITKNISLLTAQKKSAGLFNIEEKSLIQHKINMLQAELYEADNEFRKINLNIFDNRSCMKIGDTLRIGKFKDKDIEWIILKKEADRMLALSRECIAELPYHIDDSDIVWENSMLNYWLTNKFAKRIFNDYEEKYILNVPFLLSEYEVNQLLENEEIRSVGTVGSWWWLRTNNSSDKSAKSVQYDGTITNKRRTEAGGVRPAIYITNSD